MTAKTLILLAVLTNCTFVAIAAEPQLTGGTGDSLSKSSTASKSSAAIFDADWDALVKQTSLNARRGYGSGMAELLSDASGPSQFTWAPWQSFVVAAVLVTVWRVLGAVGNAATRLFRAKR